MKYLYVILLIAVLAVTAGCGNSNNKTSVSSLPTAQETASPADGLVGSDIPYILASDLCFTDYSYIQGIPELNVEGIDTLPVYKDLYPTGHGGFEAEVTEEMTHSLYLSLVSYLNLTGIEVEPEKMVLEPFPAASEAKAYVYDTDGLEIRPGLNGLTVDFDAASLVEAGDSGDKILRLLSDDVYLSAACKYSNINNPSISRTSAYNFNGEKYETVYTVYEPGKTYTDTIYNRSFKRLEISGLFAENNMATLRIYAIDTSEKAGDYALISYEDALSSLSSALGYAVEKENVLACEIEYNSKAFHGYYVPCYYFYADMGEAHNARVSGMRNYVTYYYPAVKCGDLT